MRPGGPAAGLLALVVVAAAAAAADGRPTPSLVIVGGALDRGNGRVYRAILERRIPGRPICVLATASAEPRRVTRMYVDDFRHWSGHRRAARGVRIDAADLTAADAPGMARTLSQCGGFFFTGGDQSRIVDTLRPDGRSTAAWTEILRLHRDEGAVIAGSSAGAAMMSDPMLGGGEGVWLRNGMGLFPYGLADQHHLARDRIGRLLVALAGLPAGAGLPPRGFGIDDDTALVVDGESATVIGSSQVIVVAATGGVASDRAAAVAAETTWRAWLLGDGDRWDLAAGRPDWLHRPPAPHSDQADAEPNGAGDPRESDTTLHRALADLAFSDATSVALGDDDLPALHLSEDTGFAVRGSRDDVWSAGPYLLRIGPAGGAPPEEDE